MRRATLRGAGLHYRMEVADALVAGGLQFDTLKEVHRLTSLRATLRKNSGIFHKLPNGRSGLLSWYPGVRISKADEDAAGSPATKKPPRPTPHGKQKAKRSSGSKYAHRRSGKAVGQEFDEFVLTAVADGEESIIARI